MIAIDPLYPTAQYRRALKFWIFGQTASADQTISRVMELWPKHPSAWNARFLILALTGRARAAMAMIRDDASRPESFSGLAIKTWTAALTALDDPSPVHIAAARAAIFDAARVSPGLGAHGVMMLSGLGEIDAGFEVANGLLLARGPLVHRAPDATKRQMIDSPWWKYTQWLFTPPVAAMRADPRFGPLCDGIGLTAYWRTRGVQPDYLLRRS